MGRSINRITLIGNVGRDPEVRATAGGTLVAHFSIATNRRQRAGEEEVTDWHRLTVWAQQAEFCQRNVRAGDRIYVEGELRYSAHVKNEVTIRTAEIHVREIVLLSSKSERGRAEDSEPAKVPAGAAAGSDDEDSDLPF